MFWLAAGDYRKSDSIHVLRFTKMAALCEMMELYDLYAICIPRALRAALAEPNGTYGARSAGWVLGFRA